MMLSPATSDIGCCCNFEQAMAYLGVELQNDALIGFILESQVHLVSIRSLFCPDSKTLNLTITPSDCSLRIPQ